MTRRGLWIGLGVAVAAGAVVATLALRGTGTPGAAPPGGSAASGAEDGQAAPARKRVPTTSAEQAAQFIETARAEAAAHRYLEARTLYQRAHAMHPQPATLLDVALMSHLAGQCADARRVAQRVISTAPGDAAAGKAQELLDKIGRCD